MFRDLFGINMDMKHLVITFSHSCFVCSCSLQAIGHCLTFFDKLPEILKIFRTIFFIKMDGKLLLFCKSGDIEKKNVLNILGASKNTVLNVN